MLDFDSAETFFKGFSVRGPSLEGIQEPFPSLFRPPLFKVVIGVPFFFLSARRHRALWSHPFLSPFATEDSLRVMVFPGHGMFSSPRQFCPPSGARRCPSARPLQFFSFVFLRFPSARFSSLSRRGPPFSSLSTSFQGRFAVCSPL